MTVVYVNKYNSKTVSFKVHAMNNDDAVAAALIELKKMNNYREFMLEKITCD